MMLDAAEALQRAQHILHEKGMCGAAMPGTPTRVCIRPMATLHTHGDDDALLDAVSGLLDYLDGGLWGVCPMCGLGLQEGWRGRGHAVDCPLPALADATEDRAP